MLISFIFLAAFCCLLLPNQVEGRITRLGSFRIRQELCMFVASVGVCKTGKFQIVYGYDHSTNRCVPFPYSGCGGNPNRFATVRECLKMCHVDRLNDHEEDETIVVL